MTNDLVIIEDDRVYADSRIIADKFNKRHTDLLRAIDNFEKDLVTQNNVTKESIIILQKSREYRGQRFRYCLLNEKAYNLIVMGFTGKEALKYKSDFYDAFKAMEEYIKSKDSNNEWIKSRQDGKLARKSMTDATGMLVEYAKDQGSTNAEYYYKHLTMMEYKALEFIEKANEKLGNSFRDTLDMLQLNQLFIAEKLVEAEILRGINNKTHYSQIYKDCKQVVETYAESTKLLRLKEDYTKELSTNR